VSGVDPGVHLNIRRSVVVKQVKRGGDGSELEDRGGARKEDCE
jgi:hypothetical protein